MIKKLKGGEIMYCENCGAKITEGAKFCENCGHRQEAVQNSPQAESKSEARSQSQDIRYDVELPYAQNHSQTSSNEMEEVLGMKEYLKMYLLMMVPILNLVLLFTWGFGQDVNKNKRNLAKVLLIFMAISIIPTILYVIFIVIPMMSYSTYTY